jgi:hypothetical protein
LNPAAFVYDAPLSVSSSVTVIARLRNGSFWSPRTAATFFLDSEPASAANLAVTEILYHPAAPNPLEELNGIGKAQYFEFIELTNIGSKPVDLSGVRFDNGIRFDWAHTDHPQRLLLPGASIVLVGNRDAFLLRYPDVPAGRILGEFGGALDDGGEQITLIDRGGREILDFFYDDEDGWPAEADGMGSSLVLVSPATAPDPGLPDNWTVSSVAGGDPGEAELGGSTPGDPLDDDDTDGVVNLVEWVTGSDPWDPSSVRLPEVMPAIPLGSDPPGNYVEVRYWLDAAVAANYVVELQWSEDLSTWRGEGLDWVLVSSVEEQGLQVETYRNPLPLDGFRPRLFLRLRVSGPVAAE